VPCPEHGAREGRCLFHSPVLHRTGARFLIQGLLFYISWSEWEKKRPGFRKGPDREVSA
jgi:hypothetical protein